MRLSILVFIGFYNTRNYNKNNSKIITEHTARENEGKKKVDRLLEDVYTKKNEFELMLDQSSKSLELAQKMYAAELEALKDIKAQISSTRREQSKISSRLRAMKGKSIKEMLQKEKDLFVSMKDEIRELAAITLQRYWRGTITRKKSRKAKIEAEKAAANAAANAAALIRTSSIISPGGGRRQSQNLNENTPKFGRQATTNKKTVDIYSFPSIED